MATDVGTWEVREVLVHSIGSKAGLSIPVAFALRILIPKKILQIQENLEFPFLDVKIL